MLKITNHQGNVNQNHNEISPHTHQDGHYQKNRKSALWRMWTNRNSCALLVGVAIRENSMELPQQIKNTITI